MADPAELRALAARLGESDGRAIPPDLVLAVHDALDHAYRHRHTTSALHHDIDACRDIHDAVLPGWGYRIDAPRMPGFAPGVRVDVTRPGFASWDPPPGWPDGVGAAARTVELAWMAALLLAKAALNDR